MKSQSFDDVSGIMYPWLNVACLKWLMSLDIKGWDVFEWGSGNGTVWWATHVNSITSIEHDNEWYKKIRQVKHLQNSILKLRCLINDKECTYTNAIKEDKKQYDCIIIDGRNRELCGYSCEGHLKSGGRIILDNSERPSYKRLINYFNCNLRLEFDFKPNPDNIKGCWGTTVWQLK